jgi:DNA-binding PadR family transcriptional regulator
MALTHAIMTALLEDRLSGYELARSFDTSLGFFWKASHQQIYKCLRELEVQGLLSSEEISQETRPDKVVYQLTDSGRAELDHWVAGEGQLREAKDDLFVKLYNLNEKNLPHIQRELTERAEHARARLALYRQIRERRYQRPQDMPLRQRGIYLALLAGINHCEQFLAWCDSCEALLADVK